MKKKSLLNGKEYETLNDKNVKLTKENEQLSEKYKLLHQKVLKLTEEKEKLNAEIDDLTNKNELLNQKVAMEEDLIELRDKYIKSLESILFNQEDDDNKLYPEYHTHDTFKVHNKLVEVISVLVDKDDDVYGYEVKFVDSSDTFIVYSEDIED